MLLTGHPPTNLKLSLRHLNKARTLEASFAFWEADFSQNPRPGNTLQITHELNTPGQSKGLAELLGARDLKLLLLEFFPFIFLYVYFDHAWSKLGGTHLLVRPACCACIQRELGTFQQLGQVRRWTQKPTGCHLPL
jgi:hypothetical protein